MKPKPPFISFLLLAVGCYTLFTCGVAYGDGPADNRTDQVRPIPPVGIGIPSITVETLAWVVVDKRIARFYPMEVLHLLGYRKLREHGNVLMISRRRFDLKDRG